MIQPFSKPSRPGASVRRDRKRIAKRSHSRRAIFESLEDRRLLATITVDTFADDFNGTTDGTSLREAISIANTNGSASVDEIVLSSGTYTLTRSGATEDSNALGDLDINTPAIIRGSGQGLTFVDAGGDTGIGERVFEAIGNHAITFQDLTIQGGRATAPQHSGGGLFAAGGSASLVTLQRVTVSGNEAEQQGGGITNATEAEVHVIDSIIDNNEVTAGDGGGIASTGPLTVERSTISNNTASGQGGGLLNLNANARVLASALFGNESGNGGAITNFNGDLTVVNSTISGNEATGQAGAIFNVSTGAGNVGSTILLQSTVTGNTSAGAASVHSLSQTNATSAPIRIGNSIIADNTSGFGNVGDFNTAGGSGATIISLGNNLSNDTANSRLQEPTDRLNVTTSSVFNATLADNGGWVQTHALVDATSNPAIDGGAANLAVDPGPDGLVGGGDDTALTADGRSVFVRSFDSGVDIGAFEWVTLDADDFVVTSTDDTLLIGDDNVTLRDAMIAANVTSGADTIDATGVSGTITLGGTQLEITESVTITGPGQDVLTIDANQTSRVLNVEGDASDVTLNGLTLTGGKTTGDNTGFSDNTHSGGGIRFHSSGTLTVANSDVSQNEVTGRVARGGGIETVSGTLEIQSSTISDNVSDQSEGGGVHSEVGTSTFTDSMILRNSSFGAGGGIGTFRGDVVVVNSTLSDNHTEKYSAHGGGIFAGSGNVTLSGSTLSGNHTEGDSAYGGGIITSSGNVTLSGSTLSGNHTMGYGADGGGIRTSSGNVTLTSSTLSGNQATGTDSDGGGIWFDDSVVKIISSTITGNSATGVGGGLSVFADGAGEKLTIHNSIIAGNTDDGTAPDFEAPDPPGTNLDVQSSIIGDITGFSLTTPGGNQLGVDWKTVLANDGTDATLANNGGPTQTIALVVGGPAIGLGNDSLAVDGDGNPLTTDGRGLPFARFSGTVDIGAFERQTLDPSALVVNTLTDELDFTNNDLSLREAINLASGSVGTDTITFAPSLNGGLIELSLGTLQINESITIRGPGADLLAIGYTQASLAQGRSTRIFDLGGAGAQVYRIEGLTLTGGVSDFGAAIQINDGDDRLEVIRSEIRDNFGESGAIFVGSGSLLIRDSTISGNEGAFGGGLNLQNASTRIEQSTISGNAATVRGGGILNFAGGSDTSGSLTILNSTITGNSAPTGANFDQSTQGGALAATIQIGNTIVSNPLGGGENFFNLTAESTVTSLGNNLWDDTSGPTAATGDQPNTDPKVGPLADNGGPTRTHTLLEGSPAIHAGSSALLPLSQLVTPQSVTASTAASDFRAADKLLSLPGLSVQNFANTPDTLEDSWVTTDPNGFPGDYFDGGTPSPILDFNLGTLHQLTDIVVWGYLESPNNDVKTMTVETSADGGQSFADPMTLIKPRADTEAISTLSLGGAVEANFVRVTLTDNYFESGEVGGDRVGLSEVRFLAAIPELDQRGEGFPRILGSAVDVGALESSSFARNLVVRVSDNDTDIVVVDGTTEVARFTAPLTSLTITGGPLDDTITVQDLSSLIPGVIPIQIDGGTGNDTLVLAGSGQSLDLTQNTLTGIETINIRGSGINQLTADSTITGTPDSGTILRLLADANDNLIWGNDPTVSGTRIENGVFLVTMTWGDLQSVDVVGTGWTNPIERADVDGARGVEVLDALLIINQLSRGVSELVLENTFVLIPPSELTIPFPNFFDVSRDGKITALDALQVINIVARQSNQPPEPELLIAPAKSPSLESVTANTFSEAADGLWASNHSSDDTDQTNAIDLDEPAGRDVELPTIESRDRQSSPEPWFDVNADWTGDLDSATLLDNGWQKAV